MKPRGEHQWRAWAHKYAKRGPKAWRGLRRRRAQMARSVVAPGMVMLHLTGVRRGKRMERGYRFDNEAGARQMADFFLSTERISPYRRRAMRRAGR